MMITPPFVRLPVPPTLPGHDELLQLIATREALDLGDPLVRERLEAMLLVLRDVLNYSEAA